MTSQIPRWEQRLLRSKLHLPFFTAEVKPTLAESLDTLEQHPICGRQLNNHRAERAQQADKLEFAGSLEEFTYRLLGRKACRHCAVKAGLLVRTVTIRESEEGEEQ